jgi:hypothetical protein
VVSFYESAATPACRQALALLQQQQFIKDFYLAGGTALALQIGHRISADLDWFSAERMLLATDIGLMKLAAINSRGTRRDFVDLYCLRNTISVDSLLALAATKYADRPSFLPIAARALAYFDDAERQPMPVMLKPVQWKDVRAYCEGVARRLARRFSGLD